MASVASTLSMGYPWVVLRPCIFCLVLFGTTNMGMMRKVSPPSQWTQDGWEQEDFYRWVYDFEKHHFSARTNYNVFWSANNYEMPNSIPRLDTEIEY